MKALRSAFLLPGVWRGGEVFKRNHTSRRADALTPRGPQALVRFGVGIERSVLTKRATLPGETPSNRRRSYIMIVGLVRRNLSMIMRQSG